MIAQGLLFSEPSIAETGVWCSLTEGIDPAQWASLCRYIGSLRPREFRVVREKIIPSSRTLKNTCRCSNDFVEILLVSVGPSGIGGEYQRERLDVAEL